MCVSMQSVTGFARTAIASVWALCLSVGLVFGEAGTISTNSKHLLLDKRVVDRTENARLVIGRVAKDSANPLFKEDRPWEPRFDNLYANVLYDEQDKLYKCWYSPFIIDQRTTCTPPEQRSKINYIKAKPNAREMGVCYATSQDGIAWADGRLSRAKIKTSADGPCRVRISGGKPMRGEGLVKTAEGKPVDVKLARANVVFFDTRAGEAYVIMP